MVAATASALQLQCVASCHRTGAYWLVDDGQASTCRPVGRMDVLMSMGMMMLPPVVMSLPFKLIVFVLVDGWSLVAGSLIQSYGT
jgi:hypothetical protein